MTAARFASVFVVAAALLVLARVACFALGFGDDVAIVCGAAPSGPFAFTAGVSFVVIHLLFVALAPVLALAGGLVAACLPRWRDRKRDSAAQRQRRGIEAPHRR